MRTRRGFALTLIVSLFIPAMGSGVSPVKAGVPPVPSCLGSSTESEPPTTNVVLGTPGDDQLRGTSGRDVIIGFEGEDTIRGFGGDDVLCGSEDSNPPDGDDEVRGGAGMDFILGGHGNDSLFGKGGSDNLFGNAGDDTINGGKNDFGVPDSANYWFSTGRVVADLASGTAESPDGDGTDVLEKIEGLGGSSSNDRLSGNRELNAFEGGGGPAGNDFINGRGGDDTLTLTFMSGSNWVNLEGGTALAGEDGSSDTLNSIERVLGSEQDDYLYGDAGPNVLFGGDGPDQLYGRDGIDVFLGAGGDDKLFGGAGALDYVSYTDREDLPVDLDLAAGTAERSDGDDTVDGIEMIEGASQSDSIRGDNGQNFIWAEEGDDIIDGRGGPDFLFFNGAAQSVDVDLSAETADGMGADDLFNIEHVIGSPFEDELQGDAKRNFLNGGNSSDDISGGRGDDYLAGGEGDDTLDGNGGFDAVDFFQATQKIEADLATGEALGEGTDDLIDIEALSGSFRGDTFYGSDGRDTFFGEGGRDSLFGLAGNDKLDGGPATDTLDGGADDDRCFTEGESQGCEKFSPPPDHPLTVAGRRYKKALAAQRRYKRRYK